MIDLKEIEKLRKKLLEYPYIKDVSNNIHFGHDGEYLTLDIAVISDWYGSDIADFGKKISEELGYLEDNIKIQLYKGEF